MSAVKLTTDTAAHPAPKADDILPALGLFAVPGHKIEVRHWDHEGRACATHFEPDQLGRAAAHAAHVFKAAMGVYTPLNPINWPPPPESMTRGEKRSAAADSDVAYRRFILVDSDPVREPAALEAAKAADKAAGRKFGGIPATDQEKARAEEVAGQVAEFLASEGVRVGRGDSGNGGHVLIPVYLPNDNESRDLVRGVLRGLAHRFGTPHAKIDTAVYNAARVTKLYGTIAAKGREPTRERPWRRSYLISTPTEMTPADPEILRRIAALAPREKVKESTPAPAGDRPNLAKRVAAYLDKCDPAVSGNGGHDQTFKVACNIGPGFHLSQDECFEFMRAYNKKCDPPWSEAELRHKVADAYKNESERGWHFAGDEQREAEFRARTGGRKKLVRQPSAATEAEGSGREPLMTGGDGDGPRPPQGGVSEVSGAPHPSPIPEFAESPKPLTSDLWPVPRFDPVLLPMAVRTWASDIADRMQCSIEYVAVAVVIGLAVVLGRKIAIRPKRHDDWAEVANLWGMGVGMPSVLKTPAMMEALGPLRKLAAEAMAAQEEAIEEYKREKMVAEALRDAAKEHLKKEAKKGGADRERLSELAAEASAESQLTPPVMRRFIVNDATVEKLGELLIENPNGLLTYRDELPAFFRGLDKQGHEMDRPFYLEGWNGRHSFTYDRIGRGTLHIPHVCLSLLGAIQPGPLASYVRTMISGAGEDGLIARFQLSMYPDREQDFKIVDRPPDVGARNRVYDLFRAVDRITPEDLGGVIDEHDRSGMPYLRFSDEAQELFFDWWRTLEAEKLRAKESPAMESHLGKYRSLMPKLALIFHVVEVADGGRPGPVSLPAAQMAAAWCDLLEQHARRIYLYASDGDLGPARTLAARLGKLKAPFVARDVRHKGWSGLQDDDSIVRALGQLEDFGWVKSVEKPPTAVGGRGTTVYYPHPDAVKQADEGSREGGEG